MLFLMIRNNSLVFLVYSTVVSLPTPINISYFWNFSSLISLFLISQILSSLFLSLHFSSFFMESFNSVLHINYDINFSWLMRYIHMNSASLFILLIYLHSCRSFFFKRFNNFHAWNISVLLMIISMLSAFLGYVLPWGQMSFWSATVITNLVSAFPYSEVIVFWIWGSFSVSSPTLNRFFIFHFLFPFLIAIFSLIHIYFIHNLGSSNPLSFFSFSMKVPFWPYFSYKDFLGFISLFFLFFFIVFFFSDLFSDPDNYIKANPLVTPIHIKPEWYFLFAYAILRCIPNKLMGVISLILSISVFFLLPFFSSSYSFSYIYNFFFFFWVFNFFILTWLGSCPVKESFNFLSQITSFLYFFFIFFILLIF